MATFTLAIKLDDLDTSSKDTEELERLLAEVIDNLQNDVTKGFLEDDHHFAIGVFGFIEES